MHKWPHGTAGSLGRYKTVSGLFACKLLALFAFFHSAKTIS